MYYFIGLSENSNIVNFGNISYSNYSIWLMIASVISLLTLTICIRIA